MELTEWVSRQVLDNKNALKKQFKGAKPFKHILLTNFLKADKHKAVEAALMKEQFYRKEADLFKLKQTHELKNTQSPVLLAFYQLMTSANLRKFVTELTGIKLKGGIDMSGACYEFADYLLCHDDQLSGRRIAYIYYLSEGFIEKDGGSLVLFNTDKGKPGSVAKVYPPKANSLMLFEVSTKSFHEVTESLSDKKRYTITGWLH